MKKKLNDRYCKNCEVKSIVHWYTGTGRVSVSCPKCGESWVIRRMEET